MTAQPISDPRTAGAVHVIDLRDAPDVELLERSADGGAPATGAAARARALLGGARRRVGALPGAVAARADVLLALILGAASTAVHAVGVLGFPALADDEGTYVAQAAAVRGGELAHYTYWYDHPPLGWLQLALVDWIPQHLLPGAHPVAASRVVMTVAAGVSAALLFVLARRLGVGRLFAALAVVLAFASPLSVVLQRQVYLDNIAVPWLLLSFVLVLDPRHRLAMHLFAGAAFAVAVLTKETTVVLLPVLFWGVLTASHHRTRAFSASALLAGGALVVFYPLTALLRRELVPGNGHVSLVDAIRFQLVERQGSGPMWSPGSSSHMALQSWLAYDSWLVVAGLAGLPVALLSRRLRLAGLALLVVTLVALKPGGYMPFMYVIVALPLLGLVAAGALEVLQGTATRLVAAAWARVRRTEALAVPGRVRRSLAGLVALTALGLLVPVWGPGLASAATTDENGTRMQAEAWLKQNLPYSAVVLADDVTWVHLVDDRAVPRSRAVWFYKLDTDPELAKALPGGWRDVDYVVTTGELRAAVESNQALTQASAAVRNSVLVAAFGEGGGRIEVRRVTP